MKVTRVFDLIDNLKEKYPTKEDIFALRTKTGWIKYSVDDYDRYSHLLAYAFLSAGFNKEDKVITISENRPEWNFIDMGLSLSGLIHIPVYATLGEEDFSYIFQHSDAKIIIVGSENLLKKVAPVIEKLDNKPELITIDPIAGYKSIQELYKCGEDSKEKYKPIIDQYKLNADPDSVATIIYTSGTTGKPKGVMLSHTNLVFNFIGHAVQQIKNSSHKMLSFLPLCHIYERSMNYEYQYLGISTYYAESVSSVARDIAECQADGFCAVPRMLEIMFDKFETAGNDLKGAKRHIYKWAFNFACNYDYSKTNIFHKISHNIADKLIYSKWREKLGGHEMLVVSGGSAIQARIIRLFTAAKMYIFEGYGMTEASPVIAVNNPKEMIIKIGTVGKVMDGTEVKIADDGEILSRGPHIMKGYYKDPEATKAVIDDEGFLHTGDVGVFEDGIFLKITDRKKELFKLSAGKYVSPQTIENMIKESVFITNCIVIGENKKFASAIIIPDFTVLKRYAKEIRLPIANSNSNILLQPEIVQVLNKEIELINKKLAFHEQVKRVRFISDEWTTQNGMLSQTLKLKRKNIHAKYASIINEIFS